MNFRKRYVVGTALVLGGLAYLLWSNSQKNEIPPLQPTKIEYQKKEVKEEDLLPKEHSLKHTKTPKKRTRRAVRHQVKEPPFQDIEKNQEPLDQQPYLSEIVAKTDECFEMTLSSTIITDEHGNIGIARYEQKTGAVDTVWVSYQDAEDIHENGPSSKQKMSAWLDHIKLGLEMQNQEPSWENEEYVRGMKDLLAKMDYEKPYFSELAEDEKREVQAEIEKILQARREERQRKLASYPTMNELIEAEDCLDDHNLKYSQGELYSVVENALFWQRAERCLREGRASHRAHDRYLLEMSISHYKNAIEKAQELSQNNSPELANHISSLYEKIIEQYSKLFFLGSDDDMQDLATEMEEYFSENKIYLKDLYAWQNKDEKWAELVIGELEEVGFSKEDPRFSLIEKDLEYFLCYHSAERDIIKKILYDTAQHSSHVDTWIQAAFEKFSGLGCE